MNRCPCGTRSYKITRARPSVIYVTLHEATTLTSLENGVCGV